MRAREGRYNLTSIPTSMSEGNTSFLMSVHSWSPCHHRALNATPEPRTARWQALGRPQRARVSRIAEAEQFTRK